ncbi:hypothetical protein [Photobacterium sp. 1_MG-2023]|uniref:hypothetical protein n=1 Tax=Photobacterium sp. 1_MG-2023 TaxID=3062646 RepID=UPI0026E2C916|nr:hypothetical protein [Photobacterium sp. 1_MG-2023]MDO6707945.1 hypothetical protein [Photobacterium sp. 1_MG-2023]
MTSIICWRNQEETDGIWAVSDSRVSSGNSVMTDNCPKLFSITANTFESTYYLKSNRKHLFKFGFGFAGSTLIGINVKEILSVFVSNLSEIHYYDAPDYSFEEKLPSLMDVARLSKKIGERYIQSIGVFFPNNAKCEFVIFGYCVKEKKYTSIKLSNSPQFPTEIEIEEVDISNGSYLILGDKKDYIENKIEETKKKFEPYSLNWWRSPFIALANVLREEGTGTIGGYLQFCKSTNFDTRLYNLTPHDKLDLQFVGFSLFSDIYLLGGFSINGQGGMTIPGEDGWDFTKQSG